MLIMTVEFHEARARMDEVVDAVLRGRVVVVMLLGEPVGEIRLYAVTGAASPATVESIVRRCLAMLEERISNPANLPEWLLH